ncbi:hypothetical protein GTCCBUS3UF5_32870 [Geobacillus thermoleovorans CCB_US3_UF5]|uniref:Uncharacterized protein n=2 Tax=Geobacillus TaxID=129337 RepID=A0A1Q5SLT3_9BACL|nr:hypothetical protein GTCCBUS3UF5_32870 [Geobacillus thermoleovorans CCB_US3_UF5]OKO88987.1 hypothetical protein BRO54_3450 [Geobacillus proteiniphilus]GAJ57663.1 hypothetical protein B23_0853 [Geobacillus thermoleovorans B23]
MRAVHRRFPPFRHAVAVRLTIIISRRSDCLFLFSENGEKEADAVGINESLGEKEEGRMDASHSSQSFFLPHPL